MSVSVLGVIVEDHRRGPDLRSHDPGRAVVEWYGFNLWQSCLNGDFVLRRLSESQLEDAALVVDRGFADPGIVHNGFDVEGLLCCCGGGYANRKYRR